MDLSPARSLLDRFKELRSLNPSEELTSTSEPVFRKVPCPDDIPPSMELRQDQSFEPYNGIEVMPPQIASIEELESSPRLFDVSGDPVVNSLGENVFPHGGIRTTHWLRHSYNQACTHAYESLLDWAFNNWKEIWPLAPPDVPTGRYSISKGIWFDFVAAIELADPKNSMIRISEPHTQISQNSCATADAIRSFTESGMSGVLFPDGVPDNFIPEVWFTKTESVWENSIAALEYLIKVAGVPPKAKGDSGEKANVGGRPPFAEPDVAVQCEAISKDALTSLDRKRINDADLGEWAMDHAEVPEFITEVIPDDENWNDHVEMIGKRIKRASKSPKK